LQEVVELSYELTRISSATYTRKESGICFTRTLLFISTVKVSTDRLLVSSEGVRVLDRRE